MEFPLQYSIFLPIFLLIMIAYNVSRGYRNGFVLELIISASSLICILIAWILSGIGVDWFLLIDTPMIDTSVSTLNQTIMLQTNRMLYFVCLFIISAIGLRLLRGWMRKINKLALVGTINQLLGSIIALLKSCIYGIIVIVVFASPIVRNGDMVLRQSGMMPVKEFIQTNISPIGKLFDTFDEIDKITQEESVNIDLHLGL